jgi:hypothetical protein
VVVSISAELDMLFTVRHCVRTVAYACGHDATASWPSSELAVPDCPLHLCRHFLLILIAVGFMLPLLLVCVVRCGQDAGTVVPVLPSCSSRDTL